MSLNWDATRVEGIDDLTDNERGTLQALCFSTMAVGMNKITTENAREFYTRASFMEKVLGASRRGFDGEKDFPVFYSLEDIQRFVGLMTNASPLTDAQFRKNIWESHLRWNIPR